MKTLTLSELIGETIKSVRYTYEYENEYHLQEFHAYLKLSSGIIISIPVYDEEEFLELSPENIEYYKSAFENSKEIIKRGQEKIYDRKIEDIYFCYINNEIDIDRPAFLKLSNGYYITENNFGPLGVTNVDLLIFDQREFEQRIASSELIVKSYNKEIKRRANL